MEPAEKRRLAHQIEHMSRPSEELITERRWRVLVALVQGALRESGWYSGPLGVRTAPHLLTVPGLGVGAVWAALTALQVLGWVRIGLPDENDLRAMVELDAERLRALVNEHSR